MKKIFFALFILWGGCAFATDTLFIEKVNKLFLNRFLKNPQEKLYLHTDRDHYEVGDTIWFRAYLTDVSTHKPSDLSRFVYVELRDRMDQLCKRVKMHVRDSIFAGYLVLSKKLSQGDYFLRAYSYMMQNGGDDYIFRKKIRLINPFSSRVQTSISYSRVDEQHVVDICFKNSKNEPFQNVAIVVTKGENVVDRRTNDQGNIQMQLKPSDFGKKITVHFKNKWPFEYEQLLYLPDPEKDFTVAFLPEGGNLLEGCKQTIAIKAIGKDGLSREIAGVVMNKRGEQVAQVETTHNGMGRFDLQVEPGQQYHALLSMQDGVQKRFDLPQSVHVGVGLQLTVNQADVDYVAQATKRFPKEKQLYLLVHVRGIPYLCTPVEIDIPGRLPMKSLPEGIAHFLLIDNRHRVYSERLCFIHQERPSELNLTSDKSTYLTRDRVEMNLQVPANLSTPKQGSFSVAITDDQQIEGDTLQDHMLSYLLLTSDLKGYIENPAYYFKDRQAETLRALDLLMLTQGWTRFQVSDILNEKKQPMNFFLERGQVISGKIKNFRKSDQTHMQLILRSTMGLDGILGKRVDVDSDGRFMVEGIYFPEETKFNIQAKRRGNKIYKIEIDRDSFLIPSVQIPFNPNVSISDDEFYKRFSKNYYYENGEKIYVLDEAVITRKVTRATDAYYEKVADYSYDSLQLSKMYRYDVITLIQRLLPGVINMRDTLRYMGKPILTIVNDFKEEFDYLARLRTEELTSLKLVTPLASRTFWGSQGDNGLIVINTSMNYIPDPPKNTISFDVLGYQRKAEFYVPRYDVDSVRSALAYVSDLRSTIYWNPKVETDDQGKASFVFYTSDSYGPYTVKIEGQLSDGTIYRKEEKIYLKPL